jgi:hypothetical protein
LLWLDGLPQQQLIEPPQPHVGVNGIPLPVSLATLSGTGAPSFLPSDQSPVVPTFVEALLVSRAEVVVGQPLRSRSLGDRGCAIVAFA